MWSASHQKKPASSLKNLFVRVEQSRHVPVMRSYGDVLMLFVECSLKYEPLYIDSKPAYLIFSFV